MGQRDGGRSEVDTGGGAKLLVVIARALLGLRAQALDRVQQFHQVAGQILSIAVIVMRRPGERRGWPRARKAR